MNSKLLNWRGLTVTILAGGTSLTQDEIDRAVDASTTIAVNSTWEKAPCADVIYAGDMLWWKTNFPKVKVHPAGRGAGKWTCERAAAERYGLNFIKGVNALGMSTSPRWIHTNGNSGAQAINLAYLFGARRILLLGFDMKLGPNGEKHHHADHPAPMVQAQTFSDWIYKFNFLAKALQEAECEVINCSADTALTCFPRSTIDKELP